jgi:hypothetical protein
MSAPSERVRNAGESPRVSRGAPCTCMVEEVSGSFLCRPGRVASYRVLSCPAGSVAGRQRFPRYSFPIITTNSSSRATSCRDVFLRLPKLIIILWWVTCTVECVTHRGTSFRRLAIFHARREPIGLRVSSAFAIPTKASFGFGGD